MREGDTVLVFDSKLWNGKDKDNNSKFWKRATIVNLYQSFPEGDDLADVRFHHDGRISMGHFVHSIKEIKASNLSYKDQAYKHGKNAAIAAASWVIDGNTPQDHIRRMVKWFDDGDPMKDDYLPAYPNLSGENADSMTEHKLANEICGLTNCNESLMEELVEGFSEGVADHFEPECERILRAAITEDE